MITAPATLAMFALVPLTPSVQSTSAGPQSPTTTELRPKLSQDFDGATAPNLPAGWTSGANPLDAGNTAWELGTPSFVGPSAASSLNNCAGTNLSGNYGINADIWLRTPSIDLTAGTEATLSFKEFKDFEASGTDLDFGTLRILSALDLTELAVVEVEVEGTSIGWEDYLVALPPAAFVEPIMIEFQLRSDAGTGVGSETTHNVNVNAATFAPEDLTIEVGDTVLWDWVSGLHNVESGTIAQGFDGNFTSGAPTSDLATTYSVTFDSTFLAAHPMPADAYPYYCVVHAGVGMDGLITVNPAGGVQNGDFELPVLPLGVFTNDGDPGWNITGSGGIWHPDSNGFVGGAPEGNNVGWINSGSIRQILGATLSANTQYVLSAQVGNSLNYGSAAGNTYRIELRAGGVLLDVQAGSTPGLGQWQPHSLTYDSGPNPAQEGQPLEVRLIADGTAEVDFDDVTLTGIGDYQPPEFAGWYIDDVEVRLGNAGLWQVLPNSPVAPYYHHDDLFFIDENTGWLCNISGQIWKTTDAGDSWTQLLNQPSAAFRSITFADPMNGWVGNLGPGSWVGGLSDTNPLYATIDGGVSWTPVTSIIGSLPDGICGLQAVGPDTIHGAGRYAGDAYFISSFDGGATWTSQDLSTSYNAFVDVLFFTPDEGYITSSNSSGNAALLHTIDGGASWTSVITNNAYHYWKIGFASATFGYGVAWGGVDGDTWIQTYDGGQTWTDREFAGGFEANGIGFLDEQTGWIGGDEPNTYQTTDGGNTWQLIQLDPVYPDNINKFIKVSDRVIYAVGTRVYRYSSSVGLVTDGPDGFDNSRCGLAAVSSRGNTAITYTVPEDGHVLITVYIRGGLVYDRIVDRRQRAGTYTIDYKAYDDTPVLYASIVTGRYRQVTRFSNRR